FFHTDHTPFLVVVPVWSSLMNLFQSLLNFCTRTGISKVKLNAQKHAIGFYENLGYESIPEEFIYILCNWFIFLCYKFKNIH
ncbi:GNAT family N-acetyltransferase, partial [Bacillus mycoides]